MDGYIKDMLSKGLIGIVRKPHSEKLAELIRGTSAYSGDFWHWLDWQKTNRN